MFWLFGGPVFHLFSILIFIYMIIFIKKLIIFLIPIGLIFIFPILVFFLSREYYPISEVVANQAKKPDIVYGASYSFLDRSYKKSLMVSRQPEVIALGSSRIMQLRQEFFIEPNKFTNAGGGALGLDEMVKFIQELPSDHRVKLIILDLDQEVFKPLSFVVQNEAEKPNGILKWLSTDWKRVYLDYFYGKFSLKQLFQRSMATENIGLNSLINGNGFRADGSYQYGKMLSNPNHQSNLVTELSIVSSAIERDRGSFLYGDKISPTAISSLNDILKLATERNIDVVGFLPPYPNQFYQQIARVDDVYQKNMTSLPKEIDHVFSQYHFNFYDFSDIKILGASDQEFVDPQHGTDKLFLRLAIYMAERDPLLSKYFDLERLNKTLRETKGDYLQLQ